MGTEENVIRFVIGIFVSLGSLITLEKILATNIILIYTQ